MTHYNDQQHEAFAAVLDELVGHAPGNDLFKIQEQNYAAQRASLIESARNGAYSGKTSNSDNTASGLLCGYFPCDLDQYRAVHALIYG